MLLFCSFNIRLLNKLKIAFRFFQKSKLETGFILLLIFYSTISSGQKDTIFISSGEVLSGEIKKMENHVLTFSTDYSDSDFKVEWEKVSGIRSESEILVFTSDGKRYSGNLVYHEDFKSKTFIISGDEVINISLDKIVQLIPYERKFAERLVISVDAGYTFTKSSGIHQFSSSGSVRYKSKNWMLGADFSRIGTYKENDNKSVRSDGNIFYLYSITGHLFALAGLEFLENTEQTLNLRTTSKLGTGYYFVRTNRMYFYVGAGLANNNENYSGTEPFTDNSFEGLVMMEMNLFNIGDLSGRANSSFFPGITKTGRIRLNSDIYLKYDLPLDFYIKAGITHNYDNKPPVVTSSNDFVIKTSIGWEWN